jgi:hypothetical protein
MPEMSNELVLAGDENGKAWMVQDTYDSVDLPSVQLPGSRSDAAMSRWRGLLPGRLRSISVVSRGANMRTKVEANQIGAFSHGLDPLETSSMLQSGRAERQYRPFANALTDFRAEPGLRPGSASTVCRPR